MGLSFILGPVQSMELRQEQSLVHRIQLSQLLAFSPSAIGGVLDSLNKNYEKSEDLLGSLKNRSIDAGARGIFNEFNPGKGLYDGGFILNPGLNCLESLIADKSVEEQSEVIFVQRPSPSDKPGIFFSDHILPAAEAHKKMQQVQIPPKYKRTKRLYHALAKFRDWSNLQARKGYELLSSKQREFINTLRPTMKNVYSQGHFANDLGLHETTVSRIFNYRFIIVERIDKSQVILPSKDLLCTKDEVHMYSTIEKMNSYFVRESESRECLSDEDIAKQVGCPRRTLTKYRLRAGIPSSYDRGETYKTNNSLRFVINTK